ncbi:putative ribonuclease H-like domain-containing protein [Tanacetum coccineum]
MDLFGPVFVESINKKRYCLVMTNDFSIFSWVFFLATKDETSEILCNLIIGLEKQLNHNVKIIRCDNGTEFKNYDMNELCAKKGIKKEFSVARNPQQNGVAEKKNRTLIEAPRTMLADSLLHITFWAEAVNTACYVLNRVLMTKPQNKTPYELLIGKSPIISFMRPFGCPLTILNTLDSVGKFDGKSDEGYLLGYSTSSKAFRMFDLDFLTNSMNYIPVSVENQVNVDASTQDSYVAGSSRKDKGPTQEYILLPLQPNRTRIPVKDVVQVAQGKPSENSLDQDIQDSEDIIDKEGQHQMPKDEQVLHDELEIMVTQELAAKAMDDVSRQAFKEEKRRITSQKKAAQATSINKLSTDRPSVSTDKPSVSIDRPYVSFDRPSVSTDRPFVSTNRSNTPYVSVVSTPTGANADLEDTSDTLPNDGIFNGAYDNDEDVGEEADFNNMDNTIAVEVMQEELLQFKLQKVWVLVDLPYGKKEEGIDYDEVFAPVARIEAIRLFLAFASYIGFTVYQIDVKSAFLYGTIEEEVHVHQPPGFVDPTHPNKVYKVIKALYSLHQAPRAWYETLSSFLMENGFRRSTIDKTLFIKKKNNDIIFQMSSMGELTLFLGLQVKQLPEGIFISQDKYVADIFKKFDFLSIITATTPIESNKPLVKDEDGVDVDVHVYRSMIGSLMYLTASRLDIMFAVCACARFQVTPKFSYLNAVKRIFRYLKHQPKLGLWYPRDSPFELEAYSDSDYGGASLDRKSTTGGCQFLGRRLISWQCKKQTIVANSTTEAEYVAAANYCGQEPLSVIKNPVAHSRTKHIEIRFHFIRDCYEKRLIEVIKIHTDSNVADLLTKGFDVTRFNFLVFWMIAKYRTVNNISYIDATVAGKPMTISESSIRSDLLFDDADGIDSLNNQAIFDNIQLMGRNVDGHERYKQSVKPLSLITKADEGVGMKDKIGKEDFSEEKGGTKGMREDKLLWWLEEKESAIRSTADQNEGKSATQTAPIIFGDDETIAQVLITMSQNKQKEKEKGVEIRNVEDTERPRPTSIKSLKRSFKSLLRIRGGRTGSTKNGKLKRKRKGKNNADKILAGAQQENERSLPFKQRAHFHYDTLLPQRELLAQQIVRWRLYEACGVCILELKDGTVIYMLVERRLSIHLVVYNEELAIQSKRLLVKEYQFSKAGRLPNLQSNFVDVNSVNSSYPTPSSRPTTFEVPKELPKVIMVNTSLKKLKHHLVGFDVIVKERTTITAITEGS